MFLVETSEMMCVKHSRLIPCVHIAKDGLMIPGAYCWNPLLSVTALSSFLPKNNQQENVLVHDYRAMSEFHWIPEILSTPENNMLP